MFFPSKRSAMKDVTDFKSDNDEVLSVKMTNKEFTKHYLNILNCPYTSFWIFGKYSEKEDYLKNEIQQLADIDKISYPLALEKIYSVFFNQYLDTDLDDSNFKKIENATINLSFLRHFEGLE